MNYTLDAFCPSLHVSDWGAELHQVNVLTAHVEPVDISSSCFSRVVCLAKPCAGNVWLDDFVIASLEPT